MQICPSRYSHTNSIWVGYKPKLVSKQTHIIKNMSPDKWRNVFHSTHWILWGDEAWIAGADQSPSSEQSIAMHSPLPAPGQDRPAFWNQQDVLSKSGKERTILSLLTIHFGAYYFKKQNTNRLLYLDRIWWEHHHNTRTECWPTPVSSTVLCSTLSSTALNSSSKTPS